MATRTECFACGDTIEPWGGRLTVRRLLKIVAVLAVASVLMYAEIWAIQQDPIVPDAYALEPASGASSGVDSPLRDTAGPVAVLH